MRRRHVHRRKLKQHVIMAQQDRHQRERRDERHEDEVQRHQESIIRLDQFRRSVRERLRDGVFQELAETHGVNVPSATVTTHSARPFVRPFRRAFVRSVRSVAKKRSRVLSRVRPRRGRPRGRPRRRGVRRNTKPSCRQSPHAGRGLGFSRSLSTISLKVKMQFQRDELKGKIEVR